MTALPERVPCTVVTGFLGAGKTTLIRHVIDNAGGRRLAIIVNEFGDVGIDGEILKSCGVEACPEENIVELANGCICCTVADDFVPALDKILSRRAEGRPHPDRDLRSGLAEAAGAGVPVAGDQEPRHRRRRRRGGRRRRRLPMAASPPTSMRWPAQRAADASLDHDDPVEEVFEDQVACADLIILSKSDLIDAAGHERANADHRRASVARGEDRADRQGKVDAIGPARPRPRRRGRHREPQDPSRRRTRSRARRFRQFCRRAAGDRRTRTISRGRSRKPPRRRTCCG